MHTCWTLCNPDSFIWLLAVSMVIIAYVPYMQEDPTLLLEPNHVILNHLYALSIKVKQAFYDVVWSMLCSFVQYCDCPCNSHCKHFAVLSAGQCVSASSYPSLQAEICHNPDV